MMTIGEFRVAVCAEMSRRGYDQYWESDPARGTLLQGRPKDPRQRQGRLWTLWVLARGKDKALLQSRTVGTNTAGDPMGMIECPGPGAPGPGHSPSPGLA